MSELARALERVWLSGIPFLPGGDIDWEAYARGLERELDPSRMQGAIERQINDADTEGPFTRRQWLTRRAIMAGASVWMAIEAVSSTAIEHPEINFDEEQTWEEWEASE